MRYTFSEVYFSLAITNKFQNCVCVKLNVLTYYNKGFDWQLPSGNFCLKVV